MSFKGTTSAYYLSISITHNKSRNPLLNLPINYISVISVPQILSLKDEYTFHFSIFLIVSLCISSANSHVAKLNGRWFDIM